MINTFNDENQNPEVRVFYSNIKNTHERFVDDDKTGDDVIQKTVNHELSRMRRTNKFKRAMNDPVLLELIRRGVASMVHQIRTQHNQALTAKIKASRVEAAAAAAKPSSMTASACNAAAAFTRQRVIDRLVYGKTIGNIKFADTSKFARRAHADAEGKARMANFFDILAARAHEFGPETLLHEEEKVVVDAYYRVGGFPGDNIDDEARTNYFATVD